MIYLPLYLVVHNSFFLIRPLFVCVFSLAVDVLTVRGRAWGCSVNCILFDGDYSVVLFPDPRGLVVWDRFVYVCLDGLRDDDVLSIVSTKKVVF